MRYQLTELTWEEIDGFDRERLAVLLGIAPIEEHGRHLPIGVDIYETAAWMEQAAAGLEKALPDYTFGILPVIPLGFADMGRFPGNMHVSRELVHDVVYAAVRAVADWGVRNIIVVSGHADPLHATAVEQACDQINREYGLTAIAPMGALFEDDTCPLDMPLLRRAMEECADDFHAGWVETSCMLDIRPELVKPDFTGRPDIKMEARDLMDPGKTAAAIQGEGHIGCPRYAKKELGRELNRKTGDQLQKAIRCFLERRGYEPWMHHSLYEIPGFRVPGRP